MIREGNVRLPRRCRRFGVGKEIGGAVYLHRSYEQALGTDIARAKTFLPPHFEYTIIKQHLSNGTVSFIHSPDFDTAPEPTVGDTLTMRGDGTSIFRKQAQDPFLYHHKWLMVRDDYTGFDVEESKCRSEVWSALPGIDRSRIGRKSYWDSVVVPKLLMETGVHLKVRS